MKIGMRKPSIKKSISARTKGKYKRKLKRMTNPFYGKKGMGFIKNPARSIKAKIYRKTTFSAKGATKSAGGCLGAFITIPLAIFWIIMVMMWYVLKYIIIGIVWIYVQLFNLCVVGIEWLINLKTSKQQGELIEDQTVLVDDLDKEKSVANPAEIE